MHDASLEPLWYRTATAPEPSDNAAQLALLDVDTIVVGAGIVGLSTALHLAEHGARVAVFEQGSPGAGSSGAANGQVIAGLQKDPADLLRLHGTELGERVIAFSGAAPQLLFDLLARHAIECGAERHGWIQASRSARGMKAVERRMSSWRERGADVALLDRAETQRLLGTNKYAGSWIDRRNGVVQPLDYTRGLAQAAAKLGVQLRFGVRATKLRRSQGGWFIDSDHGTARATTVVLATNVETSAVEGPGIDAAARSYLPAYSVQIATDPLPANVLASLLPERHCASDASHVHLRYFRLDAGNRFVMGGPGWLRPPKSAHASSFTRLERSTRRMFPQLEGVAFSHRWAARDGFTADLLPHLLEPAPGVFAALGCNGRGIAIGTALGSVLSRRVLGASPDSLPYPTTAAGALPLNLASAAKLQWRVATDRIRCWFA